MNTQEIFDKVVASIIKQGKPAVDYDEESISCGCQYKAEDGSKCAVGQLIPARLYRKEIEGLSGDEVIEYFLGKSENTDSHKLGKNYPRMLIFYVNSNQHMIALLLHPT